MRKVIYIEKDIKDLPRTKYILKNLKTLLLF